VGVLGAGGEAELQIEALSLVRPFAELLVWARDRDKAEAYAARMAARLQRPDSVAVSAEQAVRAAQVVVTTTPSRAPLVEAAWLHPGLHITAMGSDADGKNELAPEVLARADRLVCDRVSQCARLGELRSAIAAGLLPPEESLGRARPPELGEVIAGLKAGRESAASITVADLTGTGIQDTAIATAAFQRCSAAGAGTLIEA